VARSEGCCIRGDITIEYALASQQAGVVLIRSDRRDHLPYGLAEGCTGSPSISVLHHTDGSEEILPVMISTKIREGERIYHRQPGAGSHGNPLSREEQTVAWDVKNERVSIESAREDYGVVTDPDNFQVDQQATRLLRQQITST